MLIVIVLNMWLGQSQLDGREESHRSVSKIRSERWRKTAVAGSQWGVGVAGRGLNRMLCVLKQGQLKALLGPEPS